MWVSKPTTQQHLWIFNSHILNPTFYLFCHYSIYYDFNTLIYQKCANWELVHFCCSYHFQHPFNTAQKINLFIFTSHPQSSQNSSKRKRKMKKKKRKMLRNLEKGSRILTIDAILNKDKLVYFYFSSTILSELKQKEKKNEKKKKKNVKKFRKREQNSHHRRHLEVCK